MAAQSRPPILITRPEPQAGRFARALRRQPWVGVVQVSPLLGASRARPRLPSGDFDAVIFTSETAVLAARDLPGLPRRAWCVGPRTAAAARAQGFLAQSGGGDAQALRRAIQAAEQPGRLLYLHGKDTRVDLAEQLNSAGIETVSTLIYTQEPRPLSAAALRRIRQPGPVILPVFSPRSAALLVQAWQAAGARAQAAPVALSPAVAAALRPIAGLAIVTADRPEGTAMLRALEAQMAALTRT